MGRFGAFQDSGKLRVTHASLFSSCADRTWADADLDDVSPRLNEGLSLISSDDITSQDHMLGESFPVLMNCLNEIL
jgi:hypothetical protein